MMTRATLLVQALIRHVSYLLGGPVPEPTSNPFASPTPVFRVNNVDSSIAYYVNGLGFQLRWRASDEFACVGRDQCSIFLTTDNQSQPRMWIWIGVPDVRALHNQYEVSGARIRNPPNNFEWALEMQVEDLDGNVLRIGSDPEEDEPLGIFRDADGIRWKHLGNQKYQRVE
jgi:catechol 2,3-dioxygenase-like lactoylglutathione lyase family enzyme